MLSTTEDQVAGLCRELSDDFGLLCDALTGDALEDPHALTTALRRADVILTTAAHEESATTIGERVKKPVITIEVRPDMAVGEWALLLRQPCGR